MITPDQVSQALQQQLPAEANATANSLAEILAAVANNYLSIDAAEQKIGQDANLSNLIRKLSNQFIQTAGGVITFGSNTNTGDITINDVAGGNIIKLAVTFTTPTYKTDPQFNFASCSIAFAITFGIAITIGLAGIFVIGLIIATITSAKGLTGTVVVGTTVIYLSFFGFIWWAIYKVLTGRSS